MTSRRRQSRFLVTPPWTGALQTLEDVAFDRVAAADVWVITSAPARAGESLVLEVAGPGGIVIGTRVRASESAPIVVDDRLHQRVRLSPAVEPGATAPPSFDELLFGHVAARLAESAPVCATLVCELPVVLLDISRCGCLFECARPLMPAGVGTLTVTLGAREHVEDVRLARCVTMPGRGAFRIGAEFLRTRRPPETSLRHAIDRLLAADTDDALPGPGAAAFRAPMPLPPPARGSHPRPRR
jgi:hypothetical protein